MLLDIALDKDAITIDIEDPFHTDISNVVGNIERFASSKNAVLVDIDIKGLILKMIKGIAGCEGGCPADAKRFVEHGHENFELSYIEGGILLARKTIEDGKTLLVRMFPEF